MPFAADEVRYGLACGPGPDGRWRGWFSVEVLAGVLVPLGLHPDQPLSRPGAQSPPAWWHAAAERTVTAHRFIRRDPPDPRLEERPPAARARPGAGDRLPW